LFCVAPVLRPPGRRHKPRNGQRVPNQKGDVLGIRSNSSIKSSDFGIMPGQMEEKVSDTIELTLCIAGASPQ
jgi:hypothetical protein